MAEKCEQCLAEGIAILPTRWGKVVDSPLLEEDSYPLSMRRLLREGYIYVVDNNQVWYGYIVTEGRHLKQFEVNNITNTPNLPQADANCYSSGANCAALSSFIRIPNPENRITTLWVAYSPVKWTKSVLDKHTDGITKLENMVKIPLADALLDSKAGASGYWSNEINEAVPSTDGIFSIEYHKSEINFFTKNNYQPYKGLEREALRKTLAEHEKKNIEITKKANRVIEVIFNDPIGKLVDLNEFMIQAQLASRPTQDEVYRHTVATLINTLKNNIDEKAKADARRHIDRINEHTELMQPMPRWEGDSPSEAERQVEEQRRQEGASRYLERQRQSAWSNYSELIRESEMDRWLANFEVRSKQRQNELNTLLKTLATAYKEVFEDENLKTTMSHCFDKEDEISCIYYTLTVQQFLGSTATVPMLTDLYDEYLSKKAASDDDNYLARALAFNQDEVVKRIDSLAPITAGLSTNEIATNSWSGLLYTGSAGIFAKYDAIANQVGATVSLAEQLAVPFMKNYRTGQTLSGLMISQKEYLFGYHHEKALVIVKGQGTYADARKALMNGVMNVVGSGSLPTRIRESVDQALKTSGEVARLNKPFTQSFIYYIDKNELRAGMNVYQSGSKTFADKGALRQVIDRSIFTTPELFDQGYKDYKRFEDITNRKIDQAVRNNYFGAMLQTVACVFLVSAFFQAKSQEERLVEGSKATAGLMMLLGGSLELRGNASQLMASELKLQRGAGNLVSNEKVLTAERSAKSLSVVARGLSLGGAAIFAGFDIKSALDAKENDNETMMWAYYGSAATGAGSTVLLTLSLGAAATGIGVVLLIGFIGVTLFIGYWKKSGMENWLNLGIWGVESAGWSLEHTLEQFDRAVVGDDIDLQDN